MCTHFDDESFSDDSAVAATVTKGLITCLEGARWGSGGLAAVVPLLSRCLAGEAALSPGTDGQ